MLSPILKRRFQQIIPFGVISFMLCLLYLIIEKGILGEATAYPATGNPYQSNIFLPLFSASIMGLIFGTIEIVYLKNWFQKNSFLKKIAYKTITYVILNTLFILLLTIIRYSVELGLSPIDEEGWYYLNQFITNYTFWSIILYTSFGIGLCLFYTEVSNHIGQAVLMSLFTGKYHHPIEEERIFMFLDMKSSTTIAEKLGHLNYFKLLKTYYSDLSAPIIQHGGEIYDYIGDEIIITWKYKKEGINNSCLNCFFDMKTALQQQAEKYKSAYGLVPTFKAGIHVGKVTSGEIGVIKREITFSGDVLNTTARIQGLCNQYGVDVLISEKLNKVLKPDPVLEIKALGAAALRGRNKQINLFTVKR